MEEIRNNSGQGMGVAALITAIITFVFAVIPCVGLVAVIPGIIAIILAAISLSYASRYNAPRGTAVAGLIIGIIASLISLSQIFVAGKLARETVNLPYDIHNIIDDIQENVIKELENANVSIKVESDGDLVEIKAGTENKSDKKDFENILEDMEEGSAKNNDTIH